MAYKNPEDRRAYKRRWRAKNNEHVRRKAREVRVKNLPAARAYDREWRRAQRQKDGDTVRAKENAYFASRPEKRKRRAECSAAWHAAHPDRAKDLNALWRERNKEKLKAQEKIKAHTPERKAQRRVYRQKHLAHILAYFAKWKLARPGIMVMYVLQRRARQYGAIGDGISSGQWEEMCAAVKYRCAYCDKKFLFRDLTRDHLTPLGEGAHHLHNILPACLPCNAKKKRGPVLCSVQPFLLTVAEGPQRKPTICINALCFPVPWPACA